MPRKRSPGPPRKKDLIGQVDVFAVDLLHAANKAAKDGGGAAAPMADRISVFNSLIKWVAVKNKLADPDAEEGAAIDDLKSRLKTDDAKRASFALRGRIGRAKYNGTPHPDETAGDGGPVLDALRARLPGRSDGGDYSRILGDCDGLGGPAAAALDPDRGLRNGLPGDPEPDDSGTGGGRKL